MQAHKADEPFALNAAESWLALIDEGDSAGSWETAASMFKDAVSTEQWQTSLDAAQSAISKPVSRTLKSKQYAQDLPGTTDGEYVLIKDETAFEHKQKGTETITPVKEKDGVWRVAGYFVR